VHPIAHLVVQWTVESKVRSATNKWVGVTGPYYKLGGMRNNQTQTTISI